MSVPWARACGDGESERSSPPGDERALARAIEQALDPGRYRAAAKSIACIQSELTWTRTAEATIEVYRSIVR